MLTNQEVIWSAYVTVTPSNTPTNKLLLSDKCLYAKRVITSTTTMTGRNSTFNEHHLKGWASIEILNQKKIIQQKLDRDGKKNLNQIAAFQSSRYQSAFIVQFFSKLHPLVKVPLGKLIEDKTQPSLPPTWMESELSND